MAKPSGKKQLDVTLGEGGRRFRPERFIGFAIVVLTLLVLFSGVLVQDRMFAFRDAAHFYYPLMDYVHGEWDAGRVPLWDPYENLGVPLAGSGTAAAFYPGQLIFFLPFGFPACYKIYIVGHALLAAATSYRLARAWRLSPEASSLVALAFACSGSVLYQYCNIVFLVGAAWIPLVFLEADRMFGRRSFKHAAGCGLVLALMTLGGDPQTAYHAVLAVVLMGLIRGAGPKRSLLGDESPPTSFRAKLSRLARSRPVLLGTALAWAFGLSAVQVLLSAEAASQSERSLRSEPGSVYEAAEAWSETEKPEETKTQIVDGLLCRRLDKASHLRFVYDFSVGPWRLAELLIPNISGRQFPTHERWVERFPAERRIWSPSLYAGSIPFLLALGAVFGRRRRKRRRRNVKKRRAKSPDEGTLLLQSRRTRWLIWLTLLSVLAGFGVFGPVWAIREAANAFGVEKPPELGGAGSPVGGLYWMMTILLPKYISLRYPAKWWTLAALGMALLAGVQCDAILRRRIPKTSRRILRRPSTAFMTGIMTIVSLGLAAYVQFGVSLETWSSWTSDIRPNSMFGPFQTEAAKQGLALSFLHAFCFIGLFAIWGFWPGKKVHRTLAGCMLVLLAAADVAVANRWMIATAPQSLFGESDVANDFDETPPTRIHRHSVWYPPSWRAWSEQERLASTVDWDHESLWPKYCREHGFAATEVHGTMMPRDYFIFLCYLRQMENQPNPCMFDVMRAEYAVSRVSSEPLEEERLWTSVTPSDISEELGGQQDGWPENVAAWRYNQTGDRAWIVHHAELYPPLEDETLALLALRTQNMLWPERRFRNLSKEATIEASDAVTIQIPEAVLADSESANELSVGMLTGESCRIVSYTPSVVVIDVNMNKPGLCVLADQYYEGWTAGYATNGLENEKPATILRANRFHRAIALPEGEHRITFRYQPVSYALGATISIFAWIILLGLSVIIFLKHRLRPTS
jgi:hypothetical protein